MLYPWFESANASALEHANAATRPTHTREERARIGKLDGENARLQRELTQARLFIDVQRNVSSLLGIPMQSVEPTDEE